MTDTDISTRAVPGGGGGPGSRRNGGAPNDKFRDLEKWMPDEEDMGDDLSLDMPSGKSNGWNAEEMFKRNEQVYGVQSTYRSDLKGYTTDLQKNQDSEEFRYVFC